MKTILLAGALVFVTAVPADARFRSFQTPSGNIGCLSEVGLHKAYLRCDIRSRDWSPPPRPASCPSYTDYGQGLAFGRSRGRARFVCAGDTALDSRARKLRYGRTWRFGPFRCKARRSGLTCRNRTHSFLLSRQTYRR
jgi:hypothetical protein